MWNLLLFIRKERKFASLEELKNQIASDKEKIVETLVAFEIKNYPR